MWFLLAAIACQKAPEAIPGTQVMMEAPGGSFWDFPFPADVRRVEGRVDLSGFPNPDVNPFVAEIAGLVQGTGGFGRSSAIGMRFDGPLGALPDRFASLDADAGLFLVDVDPASAELGRRWPVVAAFDPFGEPYGALNMLSVLPVPGLALRPNTRYALVVRRELGDANGDPLGVPLAMAQIAAGEPPEGFGDLVPWVEALETLADDVDPADVAAMTVFTTGDPSESLRTLRDDALTRIRPPDAVFTPAETFDSYCVYHTTIHVPTYQQGTPPFLTEGGNILAGEGGAEYVRDEIAAVWVTIPRGPTPSGGWPTVVMVPTGGGGDRPLVDRGVHSVAHGPATAPGEGPALWIAAAGYAGVSIDLQHGGMRNPSGGDGQLLMFNIGNPTAMLDNFREAAVEVAWQAHALEGFSIDTTGCGGDTATLATGQLALLGHSMGATIAPTAAAIEPRYSTLLLSGAGGSWAENILHKQSPLAVRPVAETVIGYTERGKPLTLTDPALSLVQWAGEATDPPLHDVELADRDVLMFQGVVDTYILPPIANPLSLALRLDLGGAELDDPRFAEYDALSTLLPLSGRSQITLPATGNSGAYTRVVVQHREDGIEDGHEILFQTAAPKRQGQCFLASALADAPEVVSGEAGCP